MSDLFPVAGSKIYIGGVLASKSVDFVKSDFTSQTWVEIDGWKNAGKIGDNAQVITTALINRGRDVKQKGSANAGSMGNEFAIIPDDAGQLALIAAGAAAVKDNYAFKVAWTGGAIDLFIGLVTTAEKSGGEANTVLMLNGNIEINSNIVDGT